MFFMFIDHCSNLVAIYLDVKEYTIYDQRLFSYALFREKLLSIIIASLGVVMKNFYYPDRRTNLQL